MEFTSQLARVALFRDVRLLQSPAIARRGMIRAARSAVRNLRPKKCGKNYRTEFPRKFVSQRPLS